jgi:hypothetical protein
MYLQNDLGMIFSNFFITYIENVDSLNILKKNHVLYFFGKSEKKSYKIVVLLLKKLL